MKTKRNKLRLSLGDKKRRDAFVSAYVDETIPFQIRAMRSQKSRRWSQKDLAEKVGMKQARVSLLENPNYGNYSLRTLKQLASAFDVALVVRFVPFSELAEWTLNLSPESLEVTGFEQEQYFKITNDESDIDERFATETSGSVIAISDYIEHRDILTVPITEADSDEGHFVIPNENNGRIAYER